MRVAVSLAWILISGCGRVGFDERAAGDGGDVQAIAFAYPTENLNAVLGVSSVALQPTLTGGPATFTIAPLLPGLAIDAATGAITGTPTSMADRLPVVVTATNALGSASATLFANVLPGSVVDVTADGVDDDNGLDTTCFSSGAGGCSLRAALQTSDGRAGTGKQLVLLAAGSYMVTSALPGIDNDVVVAGAGPTATRLQGPTLHPGYGFVALATPRALTLIGLRIDGFGAVNGGAISQTMGQLLVDECDFTRNTSAGSGGVLFINGGATATLLNSTFENNTSFGGNQWGGVIDGEGTGTTITVRASTATGNQTGWGSFAHITSGTTLALESSTLYGNTSTISGTLASPGGHYTLVNDTIAYNSNTYATPNDSNLTSAGIYLYSNPAAYTLTNVLLAHNTMFDGSERECSHRMANTTVTSSGGNALGDDGYNCAADFNANDHRSADPGVDPAGPAPHGGLTPTMLLLPGAAAVDTGVNANCPKTDQRGVPRPLGPACDVGAVEMQ